MTRRFLHFAAILGFVVGQWFAVVHATQHELSSNEHSYCQTCAIAHAAGGTPAAVPPSAVFIPRGEEPPAPYVPEIVIRPVLRPHSRGPPTFLV